MKVYPETESALGPALVRLRNIIDMVLFLKKSLAVLWNEGFRMKWVSAFVEDVAD